MRGGAKPFIAYAIASVTDYGAGDEVIYPVPGFPIYESQIVANGAKPVPIHLHEDRAFAFNVEDLERLVSKRTKLLILNYPHNPTGGCLTRKDLEAVARVLEKHPQVWVYADEIYSRLVFNGEFFSIAQRPGMYERTIISDGASKTWAMTGWRIGAADSEEFRKRLLHEAGVAVLADIHFGTRVPGEGQHVRFSYAASRQAIEKGLSLIHI